MGQGWGRVNVRVRHSTRASAKRPATASASARSALSARLCGARLAM